MTENIKEAFERDLSAWFNSDEAEGWNHKTVALWAAKWFGERCAKIADTKVVHPGRILGSEIRQMIGELS